MHQRRHLDGFRARTKYSQYFHIDSLRISGERLCAHRSSVAISSNGGLMRHQPRSAPDNAPHNHQEGTTWAIAFSVLPAYANSDRSENADPWLDQHSGCLTWPDSDHSRDQRPDRRPVNFQSSTEHWTPSRNISESGNSSAGTSVALREILCCSAIFSACSMLFIRRS